MEEAAVRWNIKVSKETDLTLRTFLGTQGMKKGDLSKFIEEAVRWRVFHRTVQDIKARNADLDPDEMQSRESGWDLSRMAGGIFHAAGLRGATRRTAGYAAQGADRRAHQTVQGWTSGQRVEGTGREYRLAAARGTLPRSRGRFPACARGSG